MIAVAVLVPWLALFMRGRVLQGIICLILQISLIGWIPAAVWALMVVNNDNQERRHQELVASLRNNNSR
ncbi:YqaE/Pmp3 family membrane protein [Xanthobacter sp. AM11]|uniref:YqaE/Pmp3 family membrane protein n=1 Tax=Xanthobacter sp. AM11 TaxID=3380643 RepID=UPI0039BF763F